MSSQLAEQVLRLHRRFTLQQTQDGFSFSFLVDQNNLDFLESCQQQGLQIEEMMHDNCYFDPSEINQYHSKQVEGHLDPDNVPGLNSMVYESWESFLSMRRNITNTPALFLILEDDSVYPTANPTQTLKHYQEVQKFIGMLTDHADHQTDITAGIPSNLIFLHKNRLEVEMTFTPDALINGLDGVSIIASLLEDPTHSEQKKSILKEVLHSILANIPEQTRLHHLLQHFGEFSKRFNENYQLFVSEFSFDDVRKEYEEKKRDYLLKLNTAFAEVSAKMLGVPIALAMVSFKLSGTIDHSSLWANAMLLLAVIVYITLMIALIKNQKHSLNAIKAEYESHMARLKNQYADQYQKIEGMKSDLDNRYRFQMNTLSFFYWLFFVLFAAVLSLFAYTTHL